MLLETSLEGVRVTREPRSRRSASSRSWRRSPCAEEEDLTAGRRQHGEWPVLQLDVTQQENTVAFY